MTEQPTIVAEPAGHIVQRIEYFPPECYKVCMAMVGVNLEDRGGEIFTNRYVGLLS